MRWIFCEAPDELERREAAVARMDAFWRGFAEHTGDFEAVFRQESDFDLVEWMQTHLGSVDPGIMWEFGPATSGKGHRLVATTEGKHELRPMVDALIERAPTLEGWEFHAYRLGDPPELALQGVQARSGIDLSDAKVSVGFGADRTIALRVCTPQMTWGRNDALWSAGLVAVESLVGEETLDRWIGAVEVAPMPKPPKSWGFGKEAAVDDTLVPLGELRSRVGALVDELWSQRPAEPFHARDPAEAEWTMFELEPQDAEDYTGQADLAIARTMAPAIWRAAHGPFPFFDDRFSAHGESFVYVKLDQSDVDEERRMEAKTSVEDALLAHLSSEGLGALIGSGSGLRYGYFDIALRDRGAVRDLRAVLQQAALPERSWIRFFESHLAGEWVGVHPGTPAPPALP